MTRRESEAREQMRAGAGGRPSPIELDAGVEADAIEISPPGEREASSVDSVGEGIVDAIEGVEVVRLRPHSDHRGSLTEVIDFEHPFWVEPVVYGYRITIRPGRIKGWGMHRLQADRYLVSSPNLRVVLFDGRISSPTFGAIQELHFADSSPGLVRIPPGVWHADQNYGDEDATILNFPTRPYDRSNPDKYRVDPHSGEIPFDWELRDR